MNLIPAEWAALLYLAAAVCFILALRGLSSPRGARRGNLTGAAGALIAVVTVFLSTKLDNLPWIIGVMIVGALIAAPAALTPTPALSMPLLALLAALVLACAWFVGLRLGGFGNKQD